MAKKLFREKDFSKSELSVIDKALVKLEGQIATLEKDMPFEKVCNNDSVKYDVHGKNFFTYKCRSRDSSQLRILYRFIRKTDNSFEIECHKVFIKRKSGKEYMADFEKYVQQYSA